MSTALATLNPDLLPSCQVGSDDQLEQLTKAGDYLGRLQLYTKGKAIDKRLIRGGEYGIPESAEKIIVLGEEIDILPLARRTKAIDMSDKEAILVSYDMNSAEFQRIQATAQEKESNCMYGPSFLVFERTTGRFLEFFCGSKSTRREAGKIYPYMTLTAADIERKKANGQDVRNLEPHGPLPVTLKSRLCESGSYSWHSPEVYPCSVPFDNLPAINTIVDQINKFLTMTGDGVEKVEEPAGKKGRAR